MSAAVDTANASGSVREGLARGSLRGVFQVIPAVEVTEVLAKSGADFVVLDGEHADFSLGSLSGYVRAGEPLGLPVLYRVESSSSRRRCRPVASRGCTAAMRIRLAG